jgi:hypothetical protein
MKLLRLTLLIVLAFCSVGRGQTTNSFGIFLFAEPVDRRIIASGKGDWSHIPLSKSPLISSSDLISYNLADHSMQLKPETFARIPKPPVEGTPFVVVVNGQRIYLGTFITIESSLSFAVPTIMVNRQVLVTNQPRDTLVIEPASPPSVRADHDPRDDDRIRNALAALQKLGGDYHLIQSQIADVYSVHGVGTDTATVFVLVCPDRRLHVFRTISSHPMEQAIKDFPRGSILHYDGNALMKPPPQAQMEALTAFCRSNGISLILTDTN